MRYWLVVIFSNISFILSCVDILFVVDSNTLELSRSRAIQVARQLPNDLKFRRWVVLSRNDRYVPRVVRNNEELESVLSTVTGRYDKFLEIATTEIARRTDKYQPFVILLFSETPVNTTISDMWKVLSKAPSLHIFRIGSSRKRSVTGEREYSEFESLIACGKNRSIPIDTDSSKFDGSNEIRRRPVSTTTQRAWTSTKDPFVRRMTFYDPHRTLLEEPKVVKNKKNPITVTRMFKKISTTTSSPTGLVKVEKKSINIAKEKISTPLISLSRSRSTNKSNRSTTTRAPKNRKTETTSKNTKTSRKVFLGKLTTKPSNKITTSTGKPGKEHVKSTKRFTANTKSPKNLTRTPFKTTKVLTGKKVSVSTTTRKMFTFRISPTTSPTTISHTTTSPIAIIDEPPAKKFDNIMPKEFKVRSRSVIFAVTEKPTIPTIPQRFTSVTRKSITTTGIPVSCITDIYFLIDFSQGTGEKSQQYLDVASSAIRLMPVSQNGVRIGVIGFSGRGRSRVHFYLDRHDEKNELIREMMAIDRGGATTRTADAIRYASNVFRDPAHPVRRAAKRVLVVFTDGYSQDNPREISRIVRAQGIEILAVAMSDKFAPPDESQLLEIAGSRNNLLISPTALALRDKTLNCDL